MARRRTRARDRQWYILLEDEEQHTFAVIGPITEATSDLDAAWVDRIDEAQRAGRKLGWQYVEADHVASAHTFARGKGLSEVDASAIVSAPPDRSAEHKGRLPKYASGADRSLVVQMLCRGRCRGVRWALLNAPYPGKDELRGAQLGEFRATCLVCSYEAADNYNWYR